MNQSQRMLEYMLQGHTLTGLQAIQMFGTTTPSKRFSEIRENLSKYSVFLCRHAVFQHKEATLCDNYYLHSEPKTNGKSRWLEYSVRVVK